MEPIEKKIIGLPLDKQREVIDFIEFLQEKERKNKQEKCSFKFSWEGALSELKDKYTSVELQHEINNWRI